MTADRVWTCEEIAAAGGLRAAKIAHGLGPIRAIVASLITVWLLFLAVLSVFRPRDVQLVPDVLRLVRRVRRPPYSVVAC
jgi:hypothetical protein